MNIREHAKALYDNWFTNGQPRCLFGAVIWPVCAKGEEAASIWEDRYKMAMRRLTDERLARKRAEAKKPDASPAPNEGKQVSELMGLLNEFHDALVGEGTAGHVDARRLERASQAYELHRAHPRRLPAGSFFLSPAAEPQAHASPVSECPRSPRPCG